MRNRVLRIVPLYWLMTSVKVLLLFLSGGSALHSILSPETVVCSYLFLSARNLDGKIEPLTGVGWTLSFEVFFYALFAVALTVRANVYWFIGVAMTELSVPEPLLAAGHSLLQFHCA